MAAIKNIIADLNKGDRLNGDNFNFWSFYIKYILEEQKVIETINHKLEDPREGNIVQHRRAVETYNEWKKNDATALGILLSSMKDDLACGYKDYYTTCDIWNVLNEKLGETSMSKLHQLTIKFNTNRMSSNQSIKQHLQEMFRIIKELTAAGCNLTYEQHVQAVIHSLPGSWEHMKANLTHKQSVKTFDDVARHVELEDERLSSLKPQSHSYMTESSNWRGKFKRKRFWKKNRDKNPALKIKNNGKLM